MILKLLNSDFLQDIVFEKMKQLIVSVFICIALVSCGRQLYMPESTDATKQAKLLQGRSLYVDHCGSCHNLHLPKEYNAAEWMRNLNEMQAKAKISDEQKDLIF